MNKTRTIRQMQTAPQCAVYVWWNGHDVVGKRIAQGIGRDDLRVVARHWLTPANVRACHSSVILDPNMIPNGLSITEKLAWGIAWERTIRR